MISVNDFEYTPMAGHVIIWTPDADNMELAAAADTAVRRGGGVISCAPGAVGTLWPWLEKTHIKIMPRFYVDAVNDARISELSEHISTAMRAGAAGAQIFIRANQLKSFARAFGPLRDDLFFNHDLAIGLDIGDVDAAAWGDVFATLRGLRATTFIAATSRDSGVKSDLVGRFYAMFDAWDGGDMNLHFAPLGGVLRAEQAWRLAQKMRPELIENMRFFAAA